MQEIVVHNLDYIFTVSSHAISSAPLDVLARLEILLDTKSSESWSSRRLPTPTAKFPVIIDSEGEDDEELLRFRGNAIVSNVSDKIGRQGSDSFLLSGDYANQEISKQVRAIRKKLQQIEVLEAKQLEGHILDLQQITKLKKKSALEHSLSELGVLVESTEVKVSSSEQDGQSENKADLLRKQKKKNKLKPSSEKLHPDCSIEVGSSPIIPIEVSFLYFASVV